MSKKIVVENIADKLKSDFKVKCASRGQHMNATIIRLMRAWIMGAIELKPLGRPKVKRKK